MKSKKELSRPEFRDDMKPLIKILKGKGITMDKIRHLGAHPDVKKLIGYYPTGEWQIIIDYDGRRYFVIRGSISYGLYEVYKIGGSGPKAKDPVRFSDPKNLVDFLEEKTKYHYARKKKYV